LRGFVEVLHRLREESVRSTTPASYQPRAAPLRDRRSLRAQGRIATMPRVEPRLVGRPVEQLPLHVTVKRRKRGATDAEECCGECGGRLVKTRKICLCA
jgi:hypothetical protein